MRRAWCVQCLFRRRAALAVGVALAGLMVVGAAYASTAWRVQSSPTSGANARDELSGVAATSATNAWAVGRSETLDSSTGQTLVEHWSGKTWKMVASPDPGGSSNDNFFSAVTATSSRNAWAVGGYSNGAVYQTLIEHWNGTTWNAVASPNGGSQPNNFLYGVVATSSSNAWAVGESSNVEPLVEHWDGATWQVAASPNPGGGGVLYAVAATSPTNAWAVGESNSGLTLIEHWNGTTWKRVPSPNPGGSHADSLHGVAATSSTNAWAVGYTNRNGPRTLTLTEHWNGRRWKVVPSPNTVNGAANLSHTALWGVAATSSTNAWAVGTHPSRIHWSTTTLIEHWNGTAWKIVPSPNPGGPSRLNNLLGVAATSPTNAWAVGSYQNSLGTRPLVERGTR